MEENHGIRKVYGQLGKKRYTGERRRSGPSPHLHLAREGSAMLAWATLWRRRRRRKGVALHDHSRRSKKNQYQQPPPTKEGRKEGRKEGYQGRRGIKEGEVSRREGYQGRQRKKKEEGGKMKEGR
jgi:hypothetical protein